MSSSERIVVVGAGIGGLTTAAILARAGLNVTVLEAHVYPGGCAGTYFHKGYRFDAGATLAGGFYPDGPMDIVARAAGIDRWPAREADPAMAVLFPDGQSITRYGDERRWSEYAHSFGPTSLKFWQWQERTADALWNLALRSPAWPPQSVRESVELAGKGLAWLLSAPTRHMRPGLALDAVRPIAVHLRDLPERLRLFVDGQLLIAAQTTSARANALYGASALDLPRRGVVHLAGGIGAIAETLVDAIRRHGGTVHYRQPVARIEVRSGRAVAVKTRRGETFEADQIVGNLTPWNLAELLGEAVPSRLRNLPEKPHQGWGAFMVYVGVDGRYIPDEITSHHQVIVREPLGEGNSVFVSLSPEWDPTRGPTGHRAITISTHTALDPWWTLHAHDPEHYERRKQHYVAHMLSAAERVLPGLARHANLIMPGTPVTFQRFTRRAWGWVGGFPQTDLFQAHAPKLLPNLWMVGDSIFPGQSTAAVALGGLRVARSVLSEHDAHKVPAVTRARIATSRTLSDTG